MHEAVKAFFQQAEVSTGPVGSASRIFASYLLDVCKIGPIKDHGAPFAKALDSLMHKDDGIDIVFSIAGAPLASVREALQTQEKGGDKDLRLMSIESALVHELNERYDVKLRGSTFKGKYDGYDNTSTIGSYAFLVTSKDVPNLAVMELLRVLDNSTEEMKRDLAVGTDFQLEEFPFYETFRQQNQNFLMELMRNLLIFVVSVSITTAGALVFLSRVLSELKNVGHFRKLTKIYTDYLPENTNLDEGTGAFPKPVIYDNQTGIISKLVMGLKELLVLSSRVRQDYDTGGVTMTHYEHLQTSIANLKEMFQRNLAQRLNEFLSSNRISSDSLRHYYTAGYLRIEDLRELEARHSETQGWQLQPGTAPVSPEEARRAESQRVVGRGTREDRENQVTPAERKLRSIQSEKG